MTIDKKTLTQGNYRLKDGGYYRDVNPDTTSDSCKHKKHKNHAYREIFEEDSEGNMKHSFDEVLDETSNVCLLCKAEAS